MATAAAGSIRVLHVDDEPDFADLTATHLERQHDQLTVETERDPEAGLERLENGGFDCIVSDYDMPGTTGIDLLEAVRETHPNLPFILYTGKGSEEIASEAISAGVTDYLQKESNTDQYAVLANRIENSVAQYRAEQAAEQTRRRLAELAGNSTDCLWMFDHTWEELLFISGYEAVWGRSEAQIREDPQDFLDGVHPEDRDTAEGAMQRLSNGRSIDVEIRILTNAEETRWVWVKGTPIRDEGGDMVRVVGFTRDITERKRKERALDERNVVLQTVLENLSAGILVEDEDRNVVVANDQLTEMLAIPASAEELVGSDCAEAAAQVKDRFTESEEFIEGIETRLAERSPDRDDELELDDGRILSREYVPYTHPDGDANLWIYQDVSEYKQRERDLELQETILETVPEGVFVVDTEGGILDMYGSVDAMTGHSRDELQGKSFQTLVEAGVFTERSIEKHAEAVRDLIAADDDVVTYEVEASPGPETSRTYEVRLTLLPDERYEGTIGVARDVTERTKRARRLEELHEETEYALDGTDSLIWAIDLDTDHFERIRGPIDSVFSEDVQDIQDVDEFIEGFVHPDDRGEFARLYASLTAGSADFMELTFRTNPANGDVRWIEVEGYTQTQDDTELLIGLSTDGTDKRRREQELERQNERLEEFTGVVSHDLRNPLSVASGRVELAKADCDSEHLEGAQSALSRMETLIDDLLVLARDGKQVQDTEPVDLARVGRVCWQNVATGNASVSVETDQTIQADPSRLKQLLENLMRNAIDHGGKDVVVTLGDLPDGFYVADGGPGIPPDERDVVFEMGQTSTEDGTGFGLAIVEEIAEAHGWEISITDSEHGGARFDIEGVARVQDT